MLKKRQRNRQELFLVVFSYQITKELEKSWPK